MLQSSLRMLVPLANIQGMVPEKYWTAKPNPKTSGSPEGVRLVSFSASVTNSSFVHSFLGGRELLLLEHLGVVVHDHVVPVEGQLVRLAVDPEHLEEAGAHVLHVLVDLGIALHEVVQRIASPRETTSRAPSMATRLTSGGLPPAIMVASLSK